MVKTPETIFRIIPRVLLAFPNWAAVYPVIAKAITTAIKVAGIRMAFGNIVIANSGRIEPVGNEIIEAIAAESGLVYSPTLNPYFGGQLF